MELIKPNTNINFVGQRNKAFVLSGLLILMTVVSLIFHGGPNLGIDFAGGIELWVKFEKPVEAEQVRLALADVGSQDLRVERYGEADTHEFLVRAGKTGQEGLEDEPLKTKLVSTLQDKYGKDGVKLLSEGMVGPKVSQDLRNKALEAIFYMLVLIAIYISGRFENRWGMAVIMGAVLVGATLLVEMILARWFTGSGTAVLIITALLATVIACWVLRLRYALGAIVALIHDVVITVGVLSVLNVEFTLATVAALLTIIGYSLNDTIIVFDRIRENMSRGGKRELAGLINASVNQTLSRTILTSGTTLLVLACLYTLGGGTIEGFALTLLVGVVVGTYSSVFVASPVLLLLPEGAPAKSAGADKAETKPAKATATAAAATATASSNGATLHTHQPKTQPAAQPITQAAMSKKRMKKASGPKKKKH